MKLMSKEEFLKLRIIGKDLMLLIEYLDKAITDKVKYLANHEREKYMLARENESHHLVEWRVYRLVIFEFTGVFYEFVRTDEYYGLATKDSSEWLFKVMRKKGE